MKKIIRRIIILICRVMEIFSGFVNLLCFKKEKMTYEEAKKVLNSIYTENTFFNNEDIINLDLNEEIFVSLIIPVYNAEKYLNKCIDSIINQKTKYKYEVILVNDGSKDNSLSILEEYQKKYNFIKVVNQKNKGISVARNVGINNATGKYIGFIDNDDYIAESYIEELVNKAVEKKSDVVKCGYCSFESNTGKIQKTNLKNNISVDGKMKEELFEFNGLIWGGIIKRSLFRNFRFPIGYWYEDAITRNYIYRVSRQSEYISKILYYKREHKNNASSVLWNNGNIKALDHYFIIKGLNELCRNQGIEDDQYLYYNLILEYGPMMWWRIRGLKKIYKKSAFICAKHVIDNLNIINNDYKNQKLNKMEKAFKKGNYFLWLYNSMYLYFLI
ncbi:MAG TPA: hypothetical protein DEP51_05605 [Clostridiales bacterium]|nr:hypothetical protein [Clostridiales bacterium]